MFKRVGNSGRISDLMTPGFVYFIQAKITKAIKIGWSTNVSKRIGMLQVGTPEDLVLLHQEAGTGRDERHLHWKFSGHRINGEWFKPAPELIAYIEERRALPAKEWAPGADEPSKRLKPRLSDAQWERRRAEKEFYDNVPDDYWDYGNPGWESLKECADALQLSGRK